LYLKNPTKKSSGLHFTLKDRSGLKEKFLARLNDNELPNVVPKELTPQGHDGTDFTKDIADAVGKDNYYNSIGHLGELIKQKIIESEA
jgi:hypothetical protein